MIVMMVVIVALARHEQDIMIVMTAVIVCV